MIWLAVAFVLGIPALVLFGAWYERWHYMHGSTPCCGAQKYGYYTPFGWVVRCGKCHREEGSNA